MDFTHSPFVVILVGAVGVLLGVLILAMALAMFRKPRGPGAPPPPPTRRGSGPGTPGDDGGDIG